MAITQCRTLRKARTRKRWVVLGCTFFCTGVHFFLFALGCTFLCPLHRAQNPKVTKIWIVLLVSLCHWCSIHSFFFRRLWEWCLTELFHCTRSTRFHISWGETIRLSMIVSNPVAQADTYENHQHHRHQNLPLIPLVDLRAAHHEHQGGHYGEVVWDQVCHA